MIDMISLPSQADDDGGSSCIDPIRLLSRPLCRLGPWSYLPSGRLQNLNRIGKVLLKGVNSDRVEL